MKTFDVSNREDVKEIAHLRDHQAHDVISLNTEHLLVVGKDGFRQYDASDPKHLKMMSMIPIQKQ